MKPKRVLCLVHQELIPPERATKKELEGAEWKTEFYVVNQLKKMGHETLVLGVFDELAGISKALADFQPHITFNLLEEFDGRSLFDQNVVSYLELKKAAFTGCSPRGLILARDKALSKKILHYHRIPVPDFQVFPKGRAIRLKKKMQYPLIVKSLIEEASLGISQSSVVTSDEKLKERVEFIHESLQTDAIAEGFIEGRELYVGILGNQRIEVFPPWELVFVQPKTNLHFIATSRVKHSPDFRSRHGITTQSVEGLSEERLKTIERLCRRTYKSLNLDGYARLDLRMQEDGRAFVIEANPNPDIADYEDFAMSAYDAGYEYGELLNRILSLGIRRHHNQWME